MPNSMEQVWRRAKAARRQAAFWEPGAGSTTNAEVLQTARNIQGLLTEAGVGPGDTVLMLDNIGPRLFGAAIGTLALGGACVFVEPWMPLSRLKGAIEATRPKVFLTSILGRLWGLRVRAIRSIPQWISISGQSSQRRLHMEDVDDDTPAIITFTTGITGEPKGVVHTHGTLAQQHKLAAKLFNSNDFQGPDLCVFPQYALANMAAGRCSLLVPPTWKNNALNTLDSLPVNLQPDTLTCGPAFLLKLMHAAHVHTLQSIHIGGALTDCWIFEQGFTCWPNARWLHLYGSREAEPVAFADAQRAVKDSRSKGFFQVLALGKPVPKLKADIEEDRLWVAGPHICTGGTSESTVAPNKRKDEAGTIWHDMGDRIVVDKKQWWYGGRSSQPHEHFLLEQAVYEFLQSSSSFIHESSKGELFLVGEKVDKDRKILRKRFEQLTDIMECSVVRDRRHRACIDRAQTIRKGVPWLAG